jgi:hypothetical protein
VNSYVEKWLTWHRRRREQRQHIDAAAMVIVKGLRDGNPDPLAKFLESGGLAESPTGTVAVPQEVAEEIADMIRGAQWCWFHLTLKANKRGRTWSNDVTTDKDRWRVGFFTEKRSRELGRSGFEAAVAEAGARFGKGRTYVTEAHAMVRRYLARCDGLNAELGYQAIDGWQVLSRVYSGEIG